VAEPVLAPGPLPGTTRRLAVGRAAWRLRLARYWQAAADLDRAGRHARHALRLARSCPRAPAGFLAGIAVTLAEIEGDRQDHAAGRAHLEYALGLLEPAAPAPGRDRLLIRTLLALGDDHRRAGRYPEAARALDRALRLAEARQPADPDQLAAVLTLQGITAKELGDHQRAAACYARVGRVHRDHGTTAAQAATLQHNLAGLDYARRRYPRAETHARQAVALRRRDQAATAVDIAADVAVLAAVLAAQQRYDQARDLFRQALAGCRAARPPRRYEIAVHLHNLADIEHATGHADRAEDLYRRALAGKEQLLGPDHPEVALVANNLGTLLQQQHRDREAADLFHRALAITERSYPPDHPTTATIRRHIRELGTGAPPAPDPGPVPGANFRRVTGI
jgi:tetratricopeptide (TPR) repeat protein